MPSDFVPKRRRISNVTQARYAVVTTSENHEFEDGQVVRLIVPAAYGMNINYVQTTIDVLSPTTFETNVDTRGQLPFVEPTFPPAYTEAQVVPISGVENNIAGER